MVAWIVWCHGLAHAYWSNFVVTDQGKKKMNYFDTTLDIKIAIQKL